MTDNHSWNSPVLWITYGFFSFMVVIFLGLAITTGVAFLAAPLLIALIAVITAHFRTAPPSPPRNVAAYVVLLVATLGVGALLITEMVAYPFDHGDLFNNRELAVFSVLSTACVYGVIASGIKLTAAFLDWYLRPNLR